MPHNKNKNITAIKDRIIWDLYNLIDDVADFQVGDRISILDIQLIMRDIQELNNVGELYE